MRPGTQCRCRAVDAVRRPHRSARRRDTGGAADAPIPSQRPASEPTRPRVSAPPGVVRPAWLGAAGWSSILAAAAAALSSSLTVAAQCASPARPAPTSASSAPAMRTTTSCSRSAASSSSRTAWAAMRPARSPARWRCASVAREIGSLRGPRPTSRRGEPVRAGHPHRQRRDLRADARRARQARHGHHGDGAGAAARALPHRPGRRQPRLPAAATASCSSSPRITYVQEQVDAGCSRRSRPGSIPTAT